MYKEHKKVAVVTHVSDEKSIETEDGRRQVENSSETYLRTQLFLSVSLFLSLSLPLHGAEEVPYTHTHSLSCLCIPAALPNPHYKNKSFLFGGGKKGRVVLLEGKNDGKKKLKINIVHTATTE